jgi:uncharacterized cupredoxin-like copper-binding protein
VAALMSAPPPRALGHEAGAFGEQGDPKKPSRVVHVIMREDGNKMLYVPDTIDVKKGEQIRFVIDNEGLFNHEFVLGTEEGIRSHAAEMKRHPDMEHHDAHSLQVGMYDRGHDGKGAPALVSAGMMGDRADVIFAAPGEISAFIAEQCD